MVGGNDNLFSQNQNPFRLAPFSCRPEVNRCSHTSPQNTWLTAVQEPMWSERKGEGRFAVKLCVGPSGWLACQPIVPGVAAATGGVSLSCHYQQTSHGSGMASQRQERGGESLHMCCFCGDGRGCVDEGERAKKSGGFSPSCLWLKVFRSCLREDLVSCTFLLRCCTCWI